MNPRFLADADFNGRTIAGIARREPTLELTTADDAELCGEPDDVVLEYAAKHGLLILSHDYTTMPAAAIQRIKSGLTMTGLVMVPQRHRKRVVIDDVVLIWAASAADEWIDRIEYLTG